MSDGNKHWSFVGLLCATATAGYMCRVNVSTAGALLMVEGGLTQVEMGRVFGAFLFGYAAFQIPSGILADRFGPRRVLVVAAFLWVVLTLIQVLPGWPDLRWSIPFSFTLFLIFRFFVGIAAAPAYPAAARAVGNWIPVAQRGTASGIVLASVGLGSAMTPPLVSYAMIAGGWRWGMVASAVPAFLVALLWLKFQEPPVMVTGTVAAIHKKSAPRRLALLTISYCLQSYVGYVFVSWFFLYLVKERHFTLVTGAFASSLPWVLSIVSIPAGGWLADKLSASGLGRNWGTRLVPMLGLGFSGILIAIGAHTLYPWVAAVTLAFATALVMCVEGPFWASASRLAGARVGTAGGIMNTGGNLGGLVSPVLTPWMAQYIGWENSLHVAALLSVVAALLWLGIRADDSASE